MTSSETAKIGELIALRYLQANNFKIIEKNLKLSYLEIDLIAKKGPYLYFFEVKTRQDGIYFNEDSLISRQQIKNLKKATSSYLSSHKLYKNKFFFHLIFITLNKKTKRANLTLIPNIL